VLIIKKLHWTDWNIAHIDRHEVSRDEVEEVCERDALVVQSYKGRIAVIGETRFGRVLTIILEQEESEGMYFPVTARAASRKERCKYHDWLGGEKIA
jgi:uncharacterized DUF497 family protein